MKKVYTKPLAVMEDISLSEHIAACSMQNWNNMDFDQSIKDILHIRYGYFGANEDCENKLVDGNTFSFGTETYCYHTSADGAGVFSS